MGMAFARTDARFGPPFVLMEPLDGGNGAQYAADGGTLMFVGNGDVPNLPVEVLETRYPLRVERLELAPEVAGAGMFRGGFGIRKDYRVLEPGVFLMTATENNRHLIARGIDGGCDGGPSRVILRPDTGDAKTLTERTSGIGPLEVGSMVRAISGGGGGRGDSRLRDPALVLDDVRNEFLSVEDARAVYAVAIAGECQAYSVDLAATRSLRESPRTAAS
jgi:N-methylhydantoinase B